MTPDPVTDAIDAQAFMARWRHAGGSERANYQLFIGELCALLGLPPGDFALPIFDVVLNAKTVRGSIVGTRADLIESLALVGDGLVKSHYSTDRLDNINVIFDRMKAGAIDGRVVMTL